MTVKTSFAEFALFAQLSKIPNPTCVYVFCMCVYYSVYSWTTECKIIISSLRHFNRDSSFFSPLASKISQKCMN